ncbi:hypothetical protein DEJ34_04795 [Curtobacterium sp. MCPF17_050]|uniref:hypothetical protein n=1 Tax=Curtobacterium sp. MCPF17_050 TaxID=2175664 RepID=UPI000DA09053|nr:hypothetical protein [Curtobacterium sp. MCPF17_050]WIB16457.1 hypothetical protein DEJ34_04795 [Curtobacterium sp. MCPF17_050]
MDQTRYERLSALAAVVAALVPAVTVVIGWLDRMAAWPTSSGLGVVGLGVVGLVAGAVTAVLAARRGDRATLGFGLAAVALPLGVLLPTALHPGATVLLLLARVLLLVFGVVLVVRSSGSRRTAGWFVTVGAGVWLLSEAVMNVLFRVWIPPQGALLPLFTVPQVGEFVGFAAAALVFVPPLVRPVGAGVRRLWDTADVR